jgi:rhodanese-related sulfurtransferase
MVSEKDLKVFDVRKESEFLSEHLLEAENTPLDYLNDYLSTFPKGAVFYMHCAGGYRSMIAASILKSRGIHNLVDISGGFKAIKEAGLPVSDYVCPSTL